MTEQAAASASSLLNTEFDGTIAIVSMNNSPVNALNLEMIQTITQALKELENKKCKGFILKSEHPTVFSAGLDIKELYQPKEDRLRTFWTSLQDLWIQIYGSRMAAIALIEGHCLAGGCLLALAFDYRLMLSDNVKIGLNESKLGMSVPFWCKNSLVDTIGSRQAELALQLGTLFGTEEAHRIGLVDRLVPDKDSAIKIARSKLEEFIQIPNEARYQSKMMVRRDALENLEKNRDADLDLFVSRITQPHIQTGLGEYLTNMSKRNKC